MVSRTAHIKNLQLCPKYGELYAFLEGLGSQDQITNQTNFYDKLFNRGYTIPEANLHKFYRFVDEALIEGAELSLCEVPQLYALPTILLDYPRVSAKPFVDNHIRQVAIRLIKSYARAIGMYEKECSLSLLVLHKEMGDRHLVRFIAPTYKLPHSIRKQIEASWSNENMLPIFRTRIHGDVKTECGTLYAIERTKIHAFYKVIYDQVAEQYDIAEEAFPATEWGQVGLGSIAAELSINYTSPIDPFLTKDVLPVSGTPTTTEVPRIEIDLTQRELDDQCAVNIEIEFLKRICTEVILESNRHKTVEIIEALADQSQNKTLAKWLAQKDGWTEEQFRTEWVKFFSMASRERKYTTETIHKWSRENIAQHNKVMRSTVQGKLLSFAYESKGKIDHAQHAELVSMLCSGRFVVDKMSTGKKCDYCWYEFVYPYVNHKSGQVWKWRNEGNIPSELYTYISGGYRSLFNQVSQELCRQRDNHPNQDARKAIEKITKAFDSSRSRLGSNPEQENIIKQCHHRLLRRGMVDNLDTDGSIIGVRNGIIKLGPVCEFIDGPHEHVISKFAPTDYVPFNPDCPKVQRWLQIYLEIFGSEEVRDFMLVANASQMDGLDKSDVMINLVGGGSNGKSVFLQNGIYVLGHDYYIRSGIEALTDRRPHQGSTNENLARYKGKRGGFFSESNEDEELQSANVKNIISSENIEARGIYEKLEDFENTIFFFLATNHELRTDAFDEGFWRRMMMFKMPNKFVNNPDPDDPTQFKKDKSLRALCKDPEYRSALLSIYVHYYEIYARDYGRSLFTKVPKIIEQQTKDYRNRYDTLNRFIEQYIRPAKGVRSSLEDFAKRYQEWYKEHTGKKYVKDLRTTVQNMSMTRLFIGKTYHDRGMDTFVDGYELLDD